ncbi:hypothetical protein G5V57_18110 [Nordella sp. HKS 07]|uniref:hypothetical protein n=1 Tax=Nordella sp. HKS 07 TaxID=2712222 RepID=UPI0013E16E79|nr:hypothetical protein [Nordella sp. HKS 07]QIG49461.1 hypothetical protein G5V57_18110 [Nordella sp. HKS 07]
MYENDITLTRNLAQESANRANHLRSLTTRNVLFGSAAVVGAVGLGLAAMIWAWNQGVDPDALKQALADMPPIKVETSGQVTMKDGVVEMKEGSVALKPGALVGIDPSATVGIKEGGTVSVEGTVILEPGATVTVSDRPDVSSQPDKTEDGEAIRREVTVFSSVPFADGEVTTGWIYANGKAKEPSNQYCYFSHSKDDGSVQRIDLALNGTPHTKNGRLMLGRFSEAVRKCIWLKGGTASAEDNQSQ